MAPGAAKIPLIFSDILQAHTGAAAGAQGAGFYKLQKGIKYHLLMYNEAVVASQNRFAIQ